MSDGNGYQLTGKLTPTERRIYDVLKDGEPHLQCEIYDCLDDNGSQHNTIRVHLSNLRSKLPSGHELICQFIRRRREYRIVQRVYP